MTGIVVALTLANFDFKMLWAFFSGVIFFCYVDEVRVLYPGDGLI